MHFLSPPIHPTPTQGEHTPFRAPGPSKSWPGARFRRRISNRCRRFRGWRQAIRAHGSSSAKSHAAKGRPEEPRQGRRSGGTRLKSHTLPPGTVTSHTRLRFDFGVGAEACRLYHGDDLAVILLVAPAGDRPALVQKQPATLGPRAPGPAAFKCEELDRMGAVLVVGPEKKAWTHDMTC
eukprot:947832-Rhodomonas_salina.1